MSEIIFLAVLALIVIGPKQLPEVARTLGRFLNELKRSTNVLTDEIKQQTKLDRINFDEPFSRLDDKSEGHGIESQQLDLTDQSSQNGKKPL